MRIAGHLYPGGPYFKRLKIGENITRGVPLEYDTNNQAGFSMPAAASAVTDTPGIANTAGTFSTTEGDAEGTVEVDIRPDAIIEARMCGGATSGTALTLLANTAASAGATTVTDTDVLANDMDGGTAWRVYSNGPPGIAGESRVITTHTGSDNFVVTVPFLGGSIAVGDQFLMCPWALQGDGTAGEDGNGEVNLTTDFTEADATIASGTGAQASILDFVLGGSRDSYLQFLLADHVHRVYTT